MNAASGNGDGQPWDADYGDGTNYQYNYSHGNTASTIMFCGPESVNNTFRYNISQNEDMGLWIRPVTLETARFTTIRSISKKVSIPSGTEAMAMAVL